MTGVISIISVSLGLHIGERTQKNGRHLRLWDWCVKMLIFYIIIFINFIFFFTYLRKYFFWWKGNSWRREHSWLLLWTNVSKGTVRSFISRTVGCPCLAVPSPRSGFLHCGLGVIINPLGLSRSPLVIRENGESEVTTEQDTDKKEVTELKSGFLKVGMMDENQSGKWRHFERKSRWSRTTRWSLTPRSWWKRN